MTNFKKRTGKADDQPVPPSKRGPKVDVELTRRRKSDILHEAARLFDRQGYHRINMENIAQATGLKKPTLYHYISSKDQILFEIQEIIMTSLLDSLNERRKNKMSSVDILHGMFRDVFQIMHDYPGFVRVFFESMREIQDERRVEVRKSRRAYLNGIIEVVGEGMAQKQLRAADPRVVALCLMGTCNWSYQWYRPDRDASPLELADQCWEIAAGGVLARP